MAGSSSYERRNAAARAKGYSSYYDFRVHDNGRIPPEGQRLRGPSLARARGHTGRADLIREMRPGTLVTTTPKLSSRRADGTYGQFDVTTIDADGHEHEYLLRGSSSRDVAALQAAIIAGGGIISPSPSLDIAQMIAVEE